MYINSYLMYRSKKTFWNKFYKIKNNQNYCKIVNFLFYCFPLMATKKKSYLFYYLYFCYFLPSGVIGKV